MVVTGFLIVGILYKQKVVGRIAKWACELGLIISSSNPHDDQDTNPSRLHLRVDRESSSREP